MFTASPVAPEADLARTRSDYDFELSHAVLRSWRAAPPRGPFAEHAAAVRTAVARDGSLRPGIVLRSSGDRAYDDSCLAALATARVPPPPPILRSGVERGLVLQFEGAPPGGAAEVRRTFDERPSKRPQRRTVRVLPPSIGRAMAETAAQPRMRALRRVGQGGALAEVCAGTTGKVTRVTIVRSGGPVLDRAARADLGGWKFRPYVIAGEPVPFCFQQRLSPGG